MSSITRRSAAANGMCLMLMDTLICAVYDTCIKGIEIVQVMSSSLLDEGENGFAMQRRYR